MKKESDGKGTGIEGRIAEGGVEKKRPNKKGTKRTSILSFPVQAER